MRLPSRSVRGFAGLQLAIAAAGLHLVWGLPRLVAYLGIGRMPDPRPPLFVLSALVVAAAVVAYHAGVPERLPYAVVGLVMAGYLVGYAGWHVAGHPVLAPGGTVATTAHPSGPVAQLVGHLRSDAFAAATVACSAAALVLIAPALLRPGSGPSDRKAV